MTTANGRSADHPIDPMFLERWSSRAFTGEALSREELMTLLEAARWAPSSSNTQPWRFIYALKDSTHWPALFDLLNPSNQVWAVRAGALVLVASKTTFQPSATSAPTPSRSHSFDAGAAWGYLALQAMRSGLVAHAMGGFDHEGAHAALGIPADHRVEAMIAIGKPGKQELLSPQLAARETPNGRHGLATFAFEGRFAS